MERMTIMTPKGAALKMDAPVWSKGGKCFIVNVVFDKAFDSFGIPVSLLKLLELPDGVYRRKPEKENI